MSAAATDSASPHVVIRASAGTGKTFQLSNRYLGLAATGQAVDQILAVTFTRLAAGEILDRILLRLADAAEDPVKLSALATHLERSEFGPDECAGLLGQLTGGLHRLQVGTLDSFFSRLASSFSLELGLPPAWRIVEPVEDEQIRGDAIQRLLADHPLEDLSRLVYLLGKNTALRSITREINDVVADMYEVYRETADRPEVWKKLSRQPELEDSQLRDALTLLQTIPRPDHKPFQKALDSDLLRASEGEWEQFIAGGIAKKVLANEATFSRVPIAPEVAAAYAPLVTHARAMLVNRLAHQTEGTWRLLEHFDAAYRPLKAARRAMRFDDLTHELAAAFADGRLDDVAYRLDARTSHLLLDEFQDTSLAQWSVLRPLVRQLSEPGFSRSFFCVGDVKQAIYGWRGGTAELFNTVASEVPGLVDRRLTHSFRSSPVVIELVNQVFSDLQKNAALNEFSRVTANWNGQFGAHTTAKTIPGRCRLHVAPKADGKSGSKEQKSTTLRFAADLIQQAAERNPGRTIGVLVRRNDAIAALIYELRHRRKLLVSEEGGNALTDSPAVELILSLLVLADHPGDTAARFHVAKSPLGPAIGLNSYDDRPAAEQLARRIREELVDRGYGPTLYGWVQKLAPSCDRRDLGRMLQLVELAYRFDERPVRRPDEFLLHARDYRIADPASVPIRVMTVHKAKGLEFDIVVLPELDERLVGQPPKLVLSRSNPAGPITCVSRYVNENIQALLPAEFQEMFAARADRAAYESLCLLYVALTRAVHAVEMVIAPPSKPEEYPETLAGLLRAALAPGKPAPPAAVIFDVGDPAWERSTATPKAAIVSSASTTSESAAPAVEEIRIGLAPSRGPRRRGLDRRSPSRLEGGPRVDLRNRLQLTDSPGRTQGTLIHSWFQQIEWLENGTPDDVALRQTAAAVESPEAEVAASILRFRAMLARPEVARSLTRSSYDDPALIGFSDSVAKVLAAGLVAGSIQLELHRERSFAIRLDDAIVQGSFDRLLVFRQGTSVVAVDILDFKTDRIADPAALPQRVENYRPQLEEYRRAAAAIFKVKPQRVAARLLFVEFGKTIPLPILS